MVSRAFFEPPVRNLVFPVRRCSELEIWRGPARSTLQFSRTALHRSGKSACFSSFGGVRFATFGQSPCSRPGPGLGSAPRSTPVSDVSMGISVRRCALLGERSALMPMLTSDPRSSVRAPSDASFDPRFRPKHRPPTQYGALAGRGLALGGRPIYNLRLADRESVV